MLIKFSHGVSHKFSIYKALSTSKDKVPVLMYIRAVFATFANVLFSQKRSSI